MKYFLNSITYSKTFPIKTGAKTESQNVLIPEKKTLFWFQIQFFMVKSSHVSSEKTSSVDVT